MRRLGRWLRVRPGEGRTLLLLAGTIFAMAAGGAVGGNGIEALLFARFGTRSLPQLYVAVGLINLMTALAAVPSSQGGTRAGWMVCRSSANRA